jgi:hypothetical protein
MDYLIGKVLFLDELPAINKIMLQKIKKEVMIIRKFIKKIKFIKIRNMDKLIINKIMGI